MPSVIETAEALERAMRALEKVYPSAKAADKARIARMRNILWAQLDILARIPKGADPFAHLTSEFRHAKTRIDRIVADRMQFNAALADVTALLNSLTAVAGILALL